MSKLPTVRRLSKEDIPDSPEWFDKVLTPLNIFFESIYGALNKDITFSENISCNIKELTITTPAAYVTNVVASTPLTQFTNPLRNKPQGVITLALFETNLPFGALSIPHSVEWTFLNEKIQITHISGLTAKVKYTLRILII